MVRPLWTMATCFKITNRSGNGFAMFFLPFSRHLTFCRKTYIEICNTFPLFRLAIVDLSLHQEGSTVGLTATTWCFPKLVVWMVSETLSFQVKVDLPSAFQDFVAIMLAYNASIAILKAWKWVLSKDSQTCSLGWKDVNMCFLRLSMASRALNRKRSYQQRIGTQMTCCEGKLG